MVDRAAIGILQRQRWLRERSGASSDVLRSTSLVTPCQSRSITSQSLSGATAPDANTRSQDSMDGRASIRPKRRLSIRSKVGRICLDVENNASKRSHCSSRLQSRS